LQADPEPNFLPSGASISSPWSKKKNISKGRERSQSSLEKNSVDRTKEKKRRNSRKPKSPKRTVPQN